MIESWEKFSHREEPEYNPQDYCKRCGEYFGYSLLYEIVNEKGEDVLVCKNCLEFYEEE
jgi:formylmethanofuran dehydrogenase subunit E